MQSNSRRLFVRTAFGVALAALAAGTASADGCRDSQGRLIYCDEMGGDAAVCTDKRGFEVSCGMPGATYKNARAPHDVRTMATDRMAADVTVRQTARGAPAAAPVLQDGSASAGKRRAIAAARARDKSSPNSPRGAATSDKSGN